MTVRVKICGLSDEASLAAAVEAGADAIGFVFHQKSPRNLTLDRANALSAMVPMDVLTVAVMLHPDGPTAAAILLAIDADIIQTDQADFDYLQVPHHMSRWPVIREHVLKNQSALPSRFVYEGAGSGQGQQVDWQVAAKVAKHGEMILAGGLDATNVAEAIETVRPWAVDVSSAVESEPGKKDPQRIKEFINAVRAAG